MNGEERRGRIIQLLRDRKSPLPGTELAKQLSVSRQAIVSDIALLRAKAVCLRSGMKMMRLKKN